MDVRTNKNCKCVWPRNAHLQNNRIGLKIAKNMKYSENYLCKCRREQFNMFVDSRMCRNINKLLTAQIHTDKRSSYCIVAFE